jgi:hypothetical protein
MEETDFHRNRSPPHLVVRRDAARPPRAEARARRVQGLPRPVRAVQKPRQGVRALRAFVRAPQEAQAQRRVHVRLLPGRPPQVLHFHRRRGVRPGRIFLLRRARARRGAEDVPRAEGLRRPPVPGHGRGLLRHCRPARRQRPWPFPRRLRGGETRAEAEQVLRKAQGKYPGAAIKRMQVSFSIIDQ